MGVRSWLLESLTLFGRSASDGLSSLRVLTGDALLSVEGGLPSVTAASAGNKPLGERVEVVVEASMKHPICSFGGRGLGIAGVSVWCTGPSSFIDGSAVRSMFTTNHAL